MSGIFNFFKSLKTKSKSKTPSPPQQTKSKTPSPQQNTKTKKLSPSLKSILKTTNKTRTKNPTAITWGENKIKEISPRISPRISPHEQNINECPKKVSKQDFPCKHENKIFYRKRDYKKYKLPKCIFNKTKNNRFPCKTTKNRQTVIIDNTFELEDYIDLIVKK